MSDIKLFKVNAGSVTELKSKASDLEKQIQTLIEANLESLLGVRFLSSEYSTGKTHGGRIDSLGLDENSCPVIIEYKRSMSENVINQGLFYLDWLMDHQAEFKLLVMERLNIAADDIDWSAPRLVCIASDFTKYDVHAVQQMNRNIELVRYKKFGSDLLLLELVNATTAGVAPSKAIKSGKPGGSKPLERALADMSPKIKEIFDSLETFLLSLGDDVQRKELKLYVAYKRLRNFTCVVSHINKLVLHVSLNPDTIDLEDGFTRDVSEIGHWGTGDLEITIANNKDFDKAKPLLLLSYEGG